MNERERLIFDNMKAENKFLRHKLEGLEAANKMADTMERFISSALTGFIMRGDEPKIAAENAIATSNVLIGIFEQEHRQSEQDQNKAENEPAPLEIVKDAEDDGN